MGYLSIIGSAVSGFAIQFYYYLKLRSNRNPIVDHSEAEDLVLPGEIMACFALIYIFDLTVSVSSEFSSRF